VARGGGSEGQFGLLINPIEVHMETMGMQKELAFQM